MLAILIQEIVPGVSVTHARVGVLVVRAVVVIAGNFAVTVYITLTTEF